MLGNGADANQAVNTGVTPLYIAAHQCHAEVAQLLLDHSADVNQAAMDGTAPLFTAAQMVMQRLLSYCWSVLLMSIKQRIMDGRHFRLQLKGVMQRLLGCC